MTHSIPKLKFFKNYVELEYLILKDIISVFRESIKSSNFEKHQYIQICKQIAVGVSPSVQILRKLDQNCKICPRKDFLQIEKGRYYPPKHLKCLGGNISGS